MSYYPFDTQRCKIHLELKGNFIEFKRGLLAFNGSRHISSFYLGKLSFEEKVSMKHFMCILYLNVIFTLYRHKEIKKEIVVDFTLTTGVLNHILTVMLPTTVVVFVSVITHWFGHENFEASVCVNLTCLLVNVTLFVSVLSRY